MSGNGFDQLTKIMPSRRVVVPALAAALGVGSLTGLLLGVFSPPGPDEGAVRSAVGGTSPTATVVRSPPASATATPTRKPTVKVMTATPEAPPGQFVDEPWTDRAMEFGTLQDVGRDDRGIWVQVQRGKLLIGDAAREYLESKGQPPMDFAVVAEGGRTSRSRLRQDAVIYGQFVLGDHQTVQTQQFSADQFLDSARGALDHQVQPTIWIRHDNGIAGTPVIYLAEQYLP